MTRSYVTSYIGLFGRKDAGMPVVEKIRIPLIQRDYAQGRGGEAVARIRGAFLDALHGAVVGGDPISLDFVYGDVTHGILEPLDGQQRLTTLFLLHVYLAHRAGVPAESRPWTRFRYITRASARLFCKRLVAHPPPPDVPHESAWIVDQPWYLHTWGHDPTIQSMLVMLDAIHARFADVDAAAAWQLLTDPGAPAISFHLLPIAELQLSDQLYIKMNSRGKPLTPFETFKARFEQTLEQSCPDRTEKFALKVDGDWSDLLWPYRGDDDIIDDEFLRYFHFTTELCAWNEDRPASTDVVGLAEVVYGPGNPNAKSNIDFLIEAFDTWNSVDIAAWFHDHFAIEAPPVSASETTRAVITGLRGHSSADLFEVACRTYGIPRGRGRLFPLSLTLYLYAALLHRLRDAVDFPRRLRVVRNLVEASSNELRIERMPELRREVERIVVDDDLQEIRTFNQAQVEEERLKRSLLAEHPELKTPLFQLEDHSLLKGNLSAFRFEPERFADRATAFHRLFADTASYQALTGALLATGDYSRQLNHRFFQLGSSSRSAPWRELFTGVSRDKMKATRDVLAELLDRVSASDLPVGEELHAISAGWLAGREAQRTYSWHTYFVKYPAMREGDSGRYVGWEGKLGYLVCMLRGERVSGNYRDPYLLAIYRLSGVGEAATNPLFTGYEDNPRWLNLERSGAAVRCVEGGLALRPPLVAQECEAFSRVCATHGVSAENMLSVPQVDIDGTLVDTVDRVELGAALVRDLVDAGL